MTPEKFFDKWNEAFIDALVPIMEQVEDADYGTEGPYGLQRDNPIWGFRVWKRPVGPNDQQAVDVWWVFDPVHDEDPVRYWPALELVQVSGREIGTRSFWDELVDLDDTKTLKLIIRGLDTDVGFIIERLNRQKWIPEWEGPKEWSPGKRRPKKT